MRKKILVIFGGMSTEHIISLRSAYNIIGGLRQAGHDVLRLGITRDGRWLRFDGPDEAIPADNWQNYTSQPEIADNGAAFPASPAAWLEAICGCRPDCVFPAVHGINCEDGTLQGLLALADMPFVGSGVLASAACMDKLHAKRVFRDAGIAQASFTYALRSEIERDIQTVIERIADNIGFPCFLKPSNGGSSVGTCRVADKKDLAAALRMAGAYDRVVVVEEFVSGRELEVAVLGNEVPRTGAVGEIVTGDQVEYYDYQAKYFLEDGAQVLIPADLDEQTEAKIRQIAVRAYKAIGCTGLARVDFFLDSRDNQLKINEINTLPGFTAISVYPKSFAACGTLLPDLVDNLCRLAIEEHRAGKRQVTI